MISVEIDATALRTSMDRVRGSLRDILMAGGTSAARGIRNHIRMLARTRHGTSDRLGARPTNHFKASDVGAPTVSGSTVSIPLSTPGIGRAFHPVDILPVEARSLAIPLHADAYGFQPRELTDRGMRLFRILRRGERRGGELYNILFRRGDRGELIPMYALTQHVRQDQDRSLLPSDKALSDDFAEGAERAVAEIAGRM